MKALAEDEMLLTRCLKAALFDGRVYKIQSTVNQPVLQGLVVVLAVSICFGLGLRSMPLGLAEIPNNKESFISNENLVMAVAIHTLIFGWILWGVLAWYVGTKLLNGNASLRAILSSLGIAYGPGILLIFSPIPFNIGTSIVIIARLWILMAAFVAIAYTEDYRGWWKMKAVIPAFLGWFLVFVILQGLIIPLN